ncbi:MAG TPA: LPS assembly protein LptD, partial [Terriglobales bacterium]|nr:LPS assembly protein LptD [Terriglobales bacterium]
INTFAFEYNRDVALRTLPFTESRIGAIRTWDRAAVKLEGVYYQDLDLTGIVDLAGQGTPTGVRESRRDSLTLQRAPEIAAMGQSLIGSYLMGDFSASAVNYQRGGLDSLDLERGQGIDGLRLDLHPGLTVPLPLGKYAFGSVRGSVRETAYHLIQRDDVDGRRYDRSDSREMFQLQAQVGTALSRIYPLRQFGIDKVKHTIEPIAEYLYVPSIDQSELAFFDRIDRINRRNLATAGVTTRLIGKASPEEGEAPPLAGEGMRELGRLWLMQSVDFDRRIAQIDDFEDRGAADHFSDIDFGGHINPSRSLSLRFQSHVDTGDGELSGTTVGFFVQDWREQPQDRRLLTRTSAGVSYRFLTQDILQEINANAVIGVTRWLGLFYAARYDLLETRFLDNHFGLRLVSTCDCWALDIGVTDRSNPNELEARVQLTLVGLGSSEERVAEAP